MQFLEELGGVLDDGLVTVVAGGGQGQHVDAGDVVLQLDARDPVAGDMALLRIDERLDVFQSLGDHRIFRAELAGRQNAGHDNARDAGTLLAAPAAIVALFVFEIGERFIDDSVPQTFWSGPNFFLVVGREQQHGALPAAAPLPRHRLQKQGRCFASSEDHCQRLQ